METQYVPEFLSECIVKLKDGIAEKDRIFELLGVKPIEEDIIEAKGRFIYAGINPNKKKYRNVWIEKKELEDNLKKNKLYELKSKIHNLDNDVDNLVTNYSRTASEIVARYYKKHYIDKTPEATNHRETIEVVKKHFCRDVPKEALNTILNISEEEKAILMDNHYKKNIYDYKEASHSKAPWREEYISEEEFSSLKKKLWWLSYNKKVKKEKWSTFLQNFFRKNKLKMRKKTNNDGKILYDYSSIEPDIDYKALYRNEVTHFPAYDWSDINIDNYNNTYLPDEEVELYMKKFNPEVYFFHKHGKIENKVQ